MAGLVGLSGIVTLILFLLQSTVRCTNVVYINVTETAKGGRVIGYKVTELLAEELLENTPFLQGLHEKHTIIKSSSFSLTITNRSSGVNYLEESGDIKQKGTHSHLEKIKENAINLLNRTIQAKLAKETTNTLYDMDNINFLIKFLVLLEQEYIQSKNTINNKSCIRPMAELLRMGVEIGRFFDFGMMIVTLFEEMDVSMIQYFVLFDSMMELLGFTYLTYKKEYKILRYSAQKIEDEKGTEELVSICEILQPETDKIVEYVFIGSSGTTTSLHAALEEKKIPELDGYCLTGLLLRKVGLRTVKFSSTRSGFEAVKNCSAEKYSFQDICVDCDIKVLSIEKSINESILKELKEKIKNGTKIINLSIITGKITKRHTSKNTACNGQSTEDSSVTCILILKKDEKEECKIGEVATLTIANYGMPTSIMNLLASFISFANVKTLSLIDIDIPVRKDIFRCSHLVSKIIGELKKVNKTMYTVGVGRYKICKTEITPT